MSNFPIIPVGTKLIVEPLDKEEEKSEGGLTLINSNLSEGKVVAVSDQIKDFYKEGDIVLYPSKKGVVEPVNGKIYHWLDSNVNLEEIWGLKA